MKRRILIWALIGFLAACCWVAYTFVTPPEALGAALRQPIVAALLLITCPVSVAGRHFPLSFWLVPPLNAAAYALVGFAFEALHRPKRLGLPA